MVEPNKPGSISLPSPPRKPRGSRGRPPKLTPELTQKIIEAMRAGCYLETAAAYAGVHVDTLRDWLRKGAAGKSKAHKEFSLALEKAEGDAELQSLATIREIGGRGTTIKITKTVTRPDKSVEVTVEERPLREWTAAAWYLERRRPGRWGRRVVELQGKDGAELKSGLVQIYLPDNGRNPAGQAEDETATNRLAVITEHGGNGGHPGGGNGKPKPGRNGDGK